MDRKERRYAKTDNFTWDLKIMNHPNLAIKKGFHITYVCQNRYISDGSTSTGDFGLWLTPCMIKNGVLWLSEKHCCRRHFFSQVFCCTSLVCWCWIDGCCKVHFTRGFCCHWSGFNLWLAIQSLFIVCANAAVSRLLNPAVHLCPKQWLRLTVNET